MKKDDFVHLHVHTEFSMLDGHALISEMLQEVKSLGQIGIAATEHGNLHSAYQLWTEARKLDLIPIIGIEAYMTPGGLHHSHKQPVFFGNAGGTDKEEGGDDVSAKGTYTHMTMLAGTTEGMHNLFKMSSLSYMEGMYKKPRMSIDMLAEHGKGVIATTGCPSGDVQTRLRLGQYKEAREFAGRMQDILGRENYFLELMDHNMKSELERGVRGDLLRLARELNIPLLATNDLHYTRREDAKHHEAMLAMQTGAYLSEPTYDQGGKRFAFEGDSYYVKSGQQMRDIFGDYPEALSNTALIAERASDVMFQEEDLRPAIDIPEGHTPESYIREEINLGLIKRFGAEGITQEVRDRVEHELSVIVPKRYIMYFLVVSDFVRWAKKNGVTVGAARGCLSGDTRIITASGIKPLRELKAGDTVFDETGHPVSIPNHLMYETDENLIEISTRFAGKVKMTPDHKVLISRLSFPVSGSTPSPEWVRADEVSPGDLVVTPKLRFPETVTHLEYSGRLSHEHGNSELFSATQELGFLLGKFMAHGGFSKDDSAAIYFHEITNEDMSQITSTLRELFDVDVKVIHSIEDDYYSIVIPEVRDWLSQLFSTDLFDKSTEFPQLLLNTPEGFRKGLVDGAMTPSRAFASDSASIASGVHLMLLSLGIPSRLEEDRSFEQPHLVSSHNNTGLPTAYDGKFQYDHVNSVKQVPGDGLVYDFTVPTTHSYVTDSFVVHNSAGGSLVAYALEITELDPLRHDLLFERFLNPERDSPPDIDMDFDDQNRDRVIEYVRHKYGEERVGYVTTFGKIKAKSAIRDAAKVLEEPISVANKLSKAYPPDIMGKGMPLSDVYNPDAKRYNEAEDFRQVVKQENAERILEVARGVEHRIRQTGVHAAGIIISSKPLIDAVPLMTRSNNPTVITQFDYPTCETLGLLKVDFLGLSNLTILHDAIENIKESRGEDINLYDIFEGPMDDPATYKLLQEGNALGVFQLDSGAIRDLLRRIAPTSFDDISAAIALYRPGPMGVNAHLDYADRKNGRQEARPIHPELAEALEPVMGNTFGLCVAGDTLIWDAETGMRVRIDSIEERVKSGTFYTFGINENGDAQKNKVTHWFRTGVKNTLHIRTVTGHSVKLSEDHPVLTTRGWVEAGDLIAGIDEVALLLDPQTASLRSPSRNDISLYEKQAWSLITSIKDAPAEMMYDITVDRIHNFIGDDIVLHNCIYQEQVMQAAQQLAGYTLAEADNLRRAMGKKKKEVLDQEFIPFSAGMRKRGFSDESIKALWDVLVPFADYAFNKSHSVGYGLISYATAYLKANYPSEYMAALLTTSSDDPDRMAIYLQECKRMGLKVLPPSVDKSRVKYAASARDEIIVGLSSVRNVGKGAAQEIIDGRPDTGAYGTLQEFLANAPREVLNKRVLEGLADAGGLDHFGYSRRALSIALPDLVKAYGTLRKKEAEGQESLFDMFGEDDESLTPEIVIRDVPEFPKREKLSRERYAIGLYVSDHPLSDMADALGSRASTTTADIKEGNVPIAMGFDNTTPKQTLAGLLSSLIVKTSRNGEKFAIITIEDMVGSIEAPIFPKMYAQMGDQLKQDSIYTFTGTPRRKDEDSEEVSFMVDRLEEIESNDDGLMMTWFKLFEDQSTHEAVAAFRDVLKRHPGSSIANVSLRQKDGTIRLINMGKEYAIDNSAALRRDVQVLFGMDCLGRW